MLALVAVMLASVLVSCASSGSGATATNRGSSPTSVVTKYFSALMQRRRSLARALVCPSGWRGARKFTFLSASDTDPTKASAGSHFFQVHARARKVPGGWLVALDHSGRPLSLPLFRVVRDGGRYLVCGYVKR